MKTPKNWSATFNALPKHVRLIGSAMESLTRIQQLKMEKQRLRNRLDQSVKEINEHIQTCEEHLQRLEKEWLTSDTTEAL